MTKLPHDAFSYYVSLGPGRSYTQVATKYGVSKRAVTFKAGKATLQARGARMTPGLYQQLHQRRLALKRQWARFFQNWDVLLCPPAPVAAQKHDHLPDFHARRLDIDGVERPYLDFLCWASLATGADLPSLSAPVGLSQAGLPTGVQIIAPFLRDYVALECARTVEKVCGGFRQPPEQRPFTAAGAP